MSTDWREYIVADSNVLRGKLRIKGTRIPVSLILGYLDAGKIDDEILQEFPDVQPEHIAACFDYALDTRKY